LRIVQRAKWMNDSLTSGLFGLGNRRLKRKTTGRMSRARHFRVLKTVIAIAWPSTLRDAVPVAVRGPCKSA
jgi:hypothetical protein